MEDQWIQASEIKIVCRLSPMAEIAYSIEIDFDMRDNTGIAPVSRLLAAIRPQIIVRLSSLLGSYGLDWEISHVQDLPYDSYETTVTIKIMDRDKALLTKLAWDATIEID